MKFIRRFRSTKKEMEKEWKHIRSIRPRKKKKKKRERDREYLEKVEEES